jgi:hypothetical protein
MAMFKNVDLHQKTIAFFVDLDHSQSPQARLSKSDLPGGRCQGASTSAVRSPDARAAFGVARLS